MNFYYHYYYYYYYWGCVSKEIVVQSSWEYDVTSRVSEFQNVEQSVHRRDG